MKRLTFTIVMLLATTAIAEVKVYRWVTPDGDAMTTITSDPNKIALMDAWMVKKCKMEKPTRQMYTTEEWKAMTPEQRQAAHALKFIRKKVLYFHKKLRRYISVGDDQEYTVLAESPIGHMDKDPNDVVDLNEVE